MMKMKNALIASGLSVLILTVSACAVTRGQETVGAYFDDSALTASIKTRFVKNNAVDAAAISVETLNGTVMLSGFAKDWQEKRTAESLARQVQGVKDVKNEIAVRPQKPE